MKLYTKQEFNAMTKRQREEVFYPYDIGQGVGYKPAIKWDEVKEDEIIYIPEYGYEEGTNIPKEVYTKGDFIKLANDFNNAPDREDFEEQYFSPEALWDIVDWQSPESFLYERR